MYKRSGADILTINLSLDLGQFAKFSRKLELQEWFQIKWGVDNICTTEVELYETITFNLRNGHTFVSLEDGCGKKLQIRDISNIRPDLYSDDPIFELINLYKPVNRELKNRFVKIFHGPLPFRTKELTVEQFVLMTRFIGADTAERSLASASG